MKKTIKDYNLKGKKVIIRCDFNVPIKDGEIQDDTRIKASLKTIEYAISKGAKLILLSHLGKIKTASDLRANNLYPISIRLSELLNKKVLFSDKTRGHELEKLVANLNEGDILLIQNTRYEDLDGKKESNCDITLAKYWASLGDIFINDAYGTCHRKHASNVGISKFLPNGLGFLVEEEVKKLDEILEEDTHPFIVMMAGAKVSDKIKVIDNLINKCDKLIISGAMAYTFLKAQGYNVGSSLVDEESNEYCQNLLQKYPTKIILPIDSLVAPSIDSNNIEARDIDDFRQEDIGFDIGKKTIELFCHHLKNSARVIINGPMGLYENINYQEGTKAIYDYITTNNIKCLIGGGDSAASVAKLSDSKKFYHISTGGGATLEYLEGVSLPGISAINEKE